MSIIFEASSKAADAPDIEANIYDATFDGISKKYIEGGPYGDGERYVWAFTLLDDDGAVLFDREEPIVVDGLTSLSLNTTSKTVPKGVRYMKAILTAAEFSLFETGEARISADDLVGRKVQVEVAIRDNGWPTVVNVLPARKARRVGRSAE